jgi:hypothetical protein
MSNPYEAFLIHMEPKSLEALTQIIYANVPRGDEVILTELMNLANEIRARLEKLTNGIAQPAPVAVPKSDWLDA